MAKQITWIRKPGGSHNPRTHITEVGGDTWSCTATDVIHDILNDLEDYYVFDGNESVWVEVGVRNGNHYLRTMSDGTPLDNLLSLKNLDG